MKSAFEIMLLPEFALDEEHIICSVLTKYATEPRWSSNSTLECILAGIVDAGGKAANWDFDLILSRPTLAAINGVPC